MNGAGQIFIADRLNPRIVRVNDMTGRGELPISVDPTSVAPGLLRSRKRESTVRQNPACPIMLSEELPP